MEEESEKMAALKRAYADIILNTVKESAARVLAAERRVLSFQQYLSEAKEEAVATMLRLKAIMESKIREAEKAVLCQARKAEELELQLGEAEDTIVDLREELKRVREELKMVKDGSIQQSSEKRNGTYSPCKRCLDNDASRYTLELPRNVYDTGNNMTSSSQKTSEVECAGNVNFTSVIWRNKDSDLHRNGYKQRSHALERNATTPIGTVDESSDLHSSFKNDQLTCTSEKLASPCKIDSSMFDKTAIEVKHGVKLDDIEQKPGCFKAGETGHGPGYCDNHNAKLINRASPRKQTEIYNPDNEKSCANFNEFSSQKQNKADVLKEIPSPLVPECIETSESTQGREAAAETFNGRETLVLIQCSSATSIRNERMGIEECNQRMTKWSSTEQNMVECENKMQPNQKHNMEGIQQDSGDRGEEASVPREVTELSNYSTVNPEIGAILLPTDNKDVVVGTAQTGRDKFLMYTFQRKRKRGSSPVKIETTFHDRKPTLKTISVGKRSSLPEPSKPGVITDLPRNNRRLVQVARQLISLSEKRW
ncbi:hypothetical protein HPP92_016416 [Vanilla planifolia]|uniref:Uncharacterized protein n=1 Tax=Vanilla planifolia TaxID=51239 RepID=A0A835QK16_VANPL|nr:hypothetical protein HPP92_016416 [Vanilla planifolia]